MWKVESTGVARFSADLLEDSNRIYRSYASQYGEWWQEAQKGNDAEEEVWRLIKETELRVRKVIRRLFEDRWKEGANNKIRALLGEDAWTEITRRRADYVRRYTRRDLWAPLMYWILPTSDSSVS